MGEMLDVALTLLPQFCNRPLGRVLRGQGKTLHPIFPRAGGGEDPVAPWSCPAHGRDGTKPPTRGCGGKWGNPALVGSGTSSPRRPPAAAITCTVAVPSPTSPVTPNAIPHAMPCEMPHVMSRAVPHAMPCSVSPAMPFNTPYSVPCNAPCNGLFSVPCDAL